MPTTPVRGIVAGMTESGVPTVRVELALLPDAVPVEGWARDADGIVHAFTGWLELLEVLDRARISGPARSSVCPNASRGESP